MPIKVLVLTDVVDSTQLTESLGNEAAAALWARHDRLARDLLRKHEGLEIDRTDGFLLLFERTADAVEFALAYHRAVSRLEMRARVGVHRGEVVLHSNPADDVARGAKPVEVEGLAKPLTARIGAAARAGQTLLSGAAYGELGATDHRELSHGMWRLKGVTDPVELVEIGDAHAPFLPPDDHPKAYRVAATEDGLWLPRAEIPRSLPAERDAFVGRSAQLRALAGLLDEGSRLVTLLGPGGAGKTRLATRFGWTWLGEYPGGVWFCDLSDATGVEGICSAVARTLDLQLGGDDPVARLGHVFADRGAALIILDNFEQVVGCARATVGAWLDRAPEVRFLVTTRERLRLGGETVHTLAPLGESDAVQLFETRARQLDPDFEAEGPEREAMHQLVGLLDGLPLAIELAAARTTMLPPSDLLRRMDQRFKLLSGSSGRRPRQATLRGALDWSWDLLTPDERSALAQLSVFEGGFTLEAAEQVLELDEAWPMDGVQSLVDKSLVRVLDEVPARMGLLVSVQAYAAEKLTDREAAERRHGAWAASLGSAEAMAALLGPRGVGMQRALRREQDNLVLAIRRALERGDTPVAVGAFAAVSKAFMQVGPFRTIVELGDTISRMPGMTLRDHLTLALPRIRALALCGEYETGLALARSALGDSVELPEFRPELLALVGRIHVDMRDYDGAEVPLLDALQGMIDAGNRNGQAHSHSQLGVLYDLTGRDEEGVAQYEAAIRIFRQLGNRAGEASALANLGMHHLDRGRSEGLSFLEEALVIHREVGNRRSEGVVLQALAELREMELDEKILLYRQALTIHRQLGNRQPAASVGTNLAAVLMDRGETVEPRILLEETLPVHRELRNPLTTAITLVRLAELEVLEGHRVAARRRATEALELAKEHGLERQQTTAGAVLDQLEAPADG